MPSRTRWQIDGILVADTPLHVGSGHFREVRRVQGKRGQDESRGESKVPLVAAIARDAVGRPYLPPTTLKGMLARLLRESGLEDQIVESLVGIIKEEADLGLMGALIVRGGALLGVPPDVSAAPYADDSAQPGDKDLGPGVFVAARTSIDKRTGTAGDSTLFFQEMVAEGSKFAFRCLVEPRLGQDDQKMMRGLVIALKQLLSGAQIGKGRADGLGHMRLQGEPIIIRRTLRRDGSLFEERDRRFWTEASAAGGPKRQTEERNFRLVCDGPFIVIDSSRRAEHKSREDRVDGGTQRAGPQIVPQRLKRNLPLLLGPGVAGALRARARWLWLLALDGDQRVEQSEEDAKGFVVDDVSQVDKLNPVQRLFGVTGFRGLVSIEELRVSEAASWNATAVRIDRLSGAPIDNNLFSTETFIGSTLTFTLRIGSRGRAGATPHDDGHFKLFNSLCEDIEENGLQLGHGGNKGFGWFRPSNAGARA